VDGEMCKTRLFRSREQAELVRAIANPRDARGTPCAPPCAHPCRVVQSGTCSTTVTAALSTNTFSLLLPRSAGNSKNP
jgi:hypothetical protein